MSPHYDVAQVCMNGHVINDEVRATPWHNQKYCEKCGAETVTQCTKCGQEIRGYYRVPNVFGPSMQKPPAFCIHCGAPYPWTERRLHAAATLSHEANELNAADAKELEESLGHVLKDTPEGTVAAGRVKRLLAKAGVETAKAVKDIIVDIASEAAKKVLLP